MEVSAGHDLLASLHPLHLLLRGSVQRAGVQADGSETLHPVPERDRRAGGPAAAVGVCVCTARTRLTCSLLWSHLSSSAAPQSAGTDGGGSGMSPPVEPRSVSLIK